MDFTIIGLSQYGFIGFHKISDLWLHGYDMIPVQPGIYVIIRDTNEDPKFLSISPAGWSKGKDPTVAVGVLMHRWINGAGILYIGKAGGIGQDSNLNGRIRSYLEFGRGKRYSHRGGRYIWQLEDHEKLLVAYKPIVKNEPPRTVEKQLIQKFIAKYGENPFANILT